MQALIYVLGFVQGVGFRRFIKKKAVNLGLKGYVKNLPDGRVEILAQGEKQKIEDLRRVAEKGNIFSDVKSTVIDWQEEIGDYEGFEIYF